ncbi:MAG: disulfide oxidoreductase [Alphaproteobacteria bacterium]|nr:MAG: disulfide oxidoreductase [Alphaproteobacteria bacterium]
MNTRITALLGPTNTGKTHHAVERMLGHPTGMMGFPLRLLAREVHDRIVAARGAASVALVTGEERIIPARPRYWIATVESMPLAVPVDFLAIDEVQLAADRQRGHVFTDRILRARGLRETMLLGSDVIAPLLRRLVPGIAIRSRPRLSKLRHVPPAKLHRLPRRSAIIAFSAEEVYALGELVRRARGGAAIVMGALSPRTRNAQVAMFQNGDVDFIVATDAIGMGLNMDVDHVAFASLHKFDGERERALSAAELAQIAGRAGRHMNDGSFSTVAGAAPPLPVSIVSRIEEHRFAPLKALSWRNTDLDFHSPGRLLASLEAPSPRPELVRMGAGLDLSCLKALLKDETVQTRLGTPERLRRLWEVCQLPDFRKQLPVHHAMLVRRIFLALTGRTERIDEDWLAGEVSRLDNPQGDIDTLARRIAGIRVWTYVSHRPDWVERAEHWTAVTRRIEDRLSDALHTRLQQRFVDRRTSVLVRRLRQKGVLPVSLEENDSVIVDGVAIGRLEGFRFLPDAAREGEERKLLEKAGAAALKGEIARRVKVFVNVGWRNLTLDLSAGLDRPRISWQQSPLVEIERGDDPMRPRVRLVSGLMLDDAQTREMEQRAQTWLDERIADKLAPLLALRRAREQAEAGEASPVDDGERLSPAARGLAFRLEEAFGVLVRRDVDELLRGLDQDDRRPLRRLKVRFGATAVYLPELLKPHAMELKAMLWALARGGAGGAQLPGPGLVWIRHDAATPDGFLEMLGYLPIGGQEAIRIDMLERLADTVRPYGMNGAWFQVTPEEMGLVGCSGESFVRAMRLLGYRREEVPPLPPVAGTAGQKQESDSAATETGESREEAPAPRIWFCWQGGKPARRSPSRRRASPGGRPEKGKARRKGKLVPERTPRKAGSGARRPESTGGPGRASRPPDPDSPFAKLAALKEALERKGRDA